MAIMCKICGQEFKKQITNSHLKKHNMSTTEYKNVYGNDSLTCPAYRAEISTKYKGDANPNFGNSWSKQQRQHLSSKAKGKKAWNKGLTIDDYSKEHKDSIARGIRSREDRYENGDLVRQTHVVSDETKKKISKSVKEYARQNPESVKERSKKAVETNQKSGFYTHRREKAVNGAINTFKEYGFTALHLDNHVYKVTCDSCLSTFTRGSGQWSPTMCPGCGIKNSTSTSENEVYDFIKSLLDDIEVIQSDRTLMNPFELDIIIPFKKVAIEFNGLYWHSETSGKSKWYHRTKLDKCNDIGYTLIQIFEDEWIHKKEIVKKRLTAKLTKSISIYARKTKVEEIEKREGLDFIEKHHLQGKGYGSYFYGLFHNDELISVMSFSELNRAKGMEKMEGVFELNRFCSSTNVIGGASKLFKKFVNTVDPEKVISYSDLRWNQGNVYEKIGFTPVGKTLPGYWYVSGDKRVHRYSLKKRKDEPKDKTEYELRLEEGYHRIWDCGHAKFEWKKGD
jgi:hypothetical protein